MIDGTICMTRKQFAISSFNHSTTITLIVTSVMLLPFYYIPQLAWSQSPVPAQDNAYTRAQTEHVQVGDINIAYKRFGQGKPILLISGIGQTKEAWEPSLLSNLASTNHKVIMFDNRGIGETTDGTKPFSIVQFANDTAGLLDALQIENTDVLGYSLGSLVAQELSLNYPQKVDRLILHGTSCGGNQTVPPSEQTAEMLMTLSSPELSGNMTAEQQAMIFAQIMFPTQWLEEHPEILNSIIEAPPFQAVSPEDIRQQAMAVATWKGACDRLSSITQPTLVIVGDQDLLAPPANSIMMAQRIPHSWLVIIQGTGHGMMLQVPNEFNAIIQTFLETTQ
jgi:pimeloyl-ACP methyl ester carboxylesterase